MIQNLARCGVKKRFFSGQLAGWKLSASLLASIHCVVRVNVRNCNFKL
jgi:hypothetical protein